MFKPLFALLLTCALVTNVQAQDPRVLFDTEFGPIIVELDAQSAPITSNNFLAYVDAKYYDGMIFHRVTRISQFSQIGVIQAGCCDSNRVPRTPILPAIQNEANNGLSNVEGTIAMARGPDLNSARNEFYINSTANPALNGLYAVFGEVVFGMDVVQKIGSLPVYPFAPNIQIQDWPFRPPLINRIVRVQGDGFPVLPLHAGSWFDEANSGVGFNIEIARDTANENGARMVAYWYDFVDGEQLWLLGVAPYQYGATEVSMDLITWSGQGEVGFQNPPPNADFVTVGTLTIGFDSCESGRFEYSTEAFGSGEGNLSRLSLPEQRDCGDFE